MSFSSVDDFLRKAREAKADFRPEVKEAIDEHFEDPHLVSVPPELADTFDSLLERYGDESLRQISLFAMSKWFELHTAHIEALLAQENVQAAIAMTMDATKISQTIAMLEMVGSFGGDDDWREMAKQAAIGLVNDSLNKQGNGDNAN